MSDLIQQFPPLSRGLTRFSLRFSDSLFFLPPPSIPHFTQTPARGHTELSSLLCTEISLFSLEAFGENCPPFKLTSQLP